MQISKSRQKRKKKLQQIGKRWALLTSSSLQQGKGGLQLKLPIFGENNLHRLLGWVKWCAEEDRTFEQNVLSF
jgi:hypothetical protein